MDIEWRDGFTRTDQPIYSRQTSLLTAAFHRKERWTGRLCKLSCFVHISSPDKITAPANSYNRTDTMTLMRKSILFIPLEYSLTSPIVLSVESLRTESPECE